MNLEKITRQIDRDKSRTATHPREIKALYVASQLVLVDHHGRQRRCWREEAAIYDENIDVLGLKPRLLEQRIHGGEYNELRLASRGLHGWLGRDIMDRRGQTCLLTKTRPLEDSHLELNALRVVLQVQPRVLHEGCEGDPARDRRLEAGVVHEEDGPRLGHEVNGGDKDDEERGAEDLHQVQLQRPPEVQYFAGPHPENLYEDRSHDGY
jgi:hypothetical protein